MSIFAISDLHLSTAVDKPMDIFGGAWDNYWEIIKNNWVKYISDDDIVLIAGDISWAMNLNEAIPDLKDIGSLPGYKVIIKGNHDYWWNSVSKVRSVLPDKMYAIQNDAVRIGKYVITGTRGWICPDNTFTEEDNKIYLREGQRLDMAIKYAKSICQEGDTIVGMLHYPPFNVKHDKSIFTDIYTASGIRDVVYGHLHGKNCRADTKVNYNGVIYHLTSCDQINNMPIKLYD